MATTLKKAKSKKKFSYENEAIKLEPREFTAEEIDIFAEEIDKLTSTIQAFLQAAGAARIGDLKPAQRKKAEKLIEEETNGIVRDEIVEMITEMDSAEIRKHYAETYGESLGARKYKVFENELVTKAMEFVNTP